MKKRKASVISFILATVLLLSFPVTVFTFSSGAGTQQSPYVIKTASDLNAVRSNLSAHYVLGADIDLQDVPFMPIGSSSASFTGTFDGAGYTISNLKIELPETSPVGLFARTNGATIKNVQIVNANISGMFSAGALVGYMSGGIVDNCSVSGVGSVYAEDYAGALFGQCSGMTVISNCNAALNVVCLYEGGGGLAGVVSGGSIVSGCYATGNVFGGSVSGGLVGEFHYGTMFGCYATGDVTGNSLIGGLAGAFQGTISSCYATGNVTGLRYIGGLLGIFYSQDSMSDCYALGTITTNVANNAYVGGLIGQSYAPVQNCYFAGQILNATGISNVGGLIGYGSVPVSSYFDRTTTGYTTPPTQAKTTAAMMQASTFVGWDFVNVWAIDEGASYPYLQDVKSPFAPPMAGQGTLVNPYIIETPEHLDEVRNNLSAYYELGADIDLQNVPFMPIGNYFMPFTGVFDGAEYTISNLQIELLEANGVGLFACTNGATIQNLKIVNADISGRADVGTLIGTMGNGSVDNCSVSGTGIVYATEDYAGALFGYCGGEVVISSCYATIDVEAEIGYAGGLAGGISTGTVSDCYATGNVSGGQTLGGLVGSCDGLIMRCYATGNVTGLRYIGGLLGNFYSQDSMSDCYALGTITTNVANNAYVGGLIGQSYAPMQNCYFAGQILNATGISNVGGLIGYGSVPVSSYFDRTTTGYTTPPAQAKTTVEMMQASTFVNWDFAEVWSIAAGESYPYLRGMRNPFALPLTAPANLTCVSKTDGQITVQWDAVPGAEAYAVRCGNQSFTTTATQYVLTGLLPDTSYDIQVQSQNTEMDSAWSAVLTVVTYPPFESMTMSVDVQTAQVYSIAFTGKNISSFDNKVFTITYDPAQLQLVDFAAQTSANDTAVGVIPSADIEILSHSGGVITFTRSQTVPSGKVWSGVLTVMKFKALGTGTVSIEIAQ